MLGHSHPESTLNGAYTWKKVLAGHMDAFTRQFAASSDPCPFCSVLFFLPGCNHFLLRSWLPFFFTSLFIPPRTQGITGCPCQPQPWQENKPGWEIPAATGTVSVPLSFQNSTYSTIWQPTISLDTFRSI